MSFEGQNARAKVRLELPNGILLEVPLAVIVEGLRAAYLGEEKASQKWAFVNEGRATYLIVSVSDPEKT